MKYSGKYTNLHFVFQSRASDSDEEYDGFTGRLYEYAN